MIQMTIHVYSVCKIHWAVYSWSIHISVYTLCFNKKLKIKRIWNLKTKATHDLLALPHLYFTNVSRHVSSKGKKQDIFSWISTVFFCFCEPMFGYFNDEYYIFSFSCLHRVRNPSWFKEKQQPNQPSSSIHTRHS